MNSQIVSGSLSDLAQKNETSLAETWLSVDAVILIDVSSSMSQSDGELPRIDRARNALKNLQSKYSGKLAVFTFSDFTTFMPYGYIAGVEGMTDLTKALKFVKVADGIPDMKFIVISDGEPNDAPSALAEATKFENKIDTIFIGAGGYGAEFLAKLSAKSGGKSMTGNAHEIEQKTTLLLGG